MQFIAQDLRSGETRLVSGPAPGPAPRGIVVRSLASLVSAGTERMLVDFGTGNLVQKARQQPDRVAAVIDKARIDGISATVDAVRSKLDQPLALGYAQAGVVVAVGAEVEGFEVGDLAATNGGHAEVVAVPTTLAARIPDGVPAEQACFASVVGIGLQSLRLSVPEVGERFAVVGLGLVGLIVTDLLRAQGCAVLGIDPSPARRARAEALGATVAEPGAGAETLAASFSRDRGVDGTIICASTASDEPVRSAVRMCRPRGRVVLVGVAGLELDRTEMYRKEVSVSVSCSYGAGRYDPRYESGHDYPVGLARWTVARNMEAALDLMATGRLHLGDLITHRVPFGDAPISYQPTLKDPDALGIILEYPERTEEGDVAVLARSTLSAGGVGPGGTGGVALIGAGNFSARVLAPAIRSAGRRIDVVASRTGTDAALLARAGDGAGRVTTDIDAVIADPAIGTVFVATRHDSHARLAAGAVRAGKSVYVEKPLALTHEELDDIEAALAEAVAAGHAPVLAVGFNRRHAPATARMLELLAGRPGPKAIQMTVNAGAVPGGHWTQDAVLGGGRILGEACHFVDLARALVGAPITDVRTRHLGAAPHDTASISLGFEDGSIAEISYVAVGGPKTPKERIVVSTGGTTLVNENFRTVRTDGFAGAGTTRWRRQDKGHQAAVGRFLDAAAGRGPVTPLAEVLEVSRAAIEAARRA